MGQEIVNQVQEVQRVSYRINPGRNKPRHMLIKINNIKHKERIPKATGEKQQATYKGSPIHLIADLSAETLQARRERQDIFKVLKGKNLQARLLYPARISFKIDGETKSFSEENSVPPNQLYNKCYRDLYSQEIQGKRNIYKVKQQLRKW